MNVRRRIAVEDGMKGYIVESSRHPESKVVALALRQVSRVYGAAWKPRAVT